MSFVILFVLFGADLAAQDSTKFSTPELQINFSYLTELEYRRVESETQSDKVWLLKAKIDQFETLYELEKQVNANLSKQLEIIKPAWYNNFTTGAIAGVGIAAALVYLLR